MRRKRRISAIVLCVVIIAALVIVLLLPAVTRAAEKSEKAKASAKESYYVSGAVDVKSKAGGAVFYAKQYSRDGEYFCRIIRKKNGKKMTVASGVDAAFVTNGRIIYYAKKGARINDWQYQQTICRKDLKTKKVVKIASGTEYTPIGCSGKYLYAGTDNGPDGVDLYAINVKTKKKRHMVDVVGGVQISGGYVLTRTNSGDLGNYPVYIFKENGSGKKKIANACGARIKGKYIYYVKVDETTYSRFKEYRCTLSGRQKKAVSGWQNEYPAER